MPSATSPSPAKSSGIQTTATGERHIPQSVRADGSLRKEIKIRPGYRPPEDVEVYKNRTAEAWKTRGNGGVPGADGLGNENAAKGSATKNAKRREARKKAKAAEAAEEGEIGGVQREQIIDENVDDKSDDQTTLKLIPDSMEEDQRSETPQAPAMSIKEQQDPDTEIEKQARNLRKKLRQARELKERKDSGESLLPEQFAKVIKIQELIRQLDALGFDNDGARKVKDVR
ncbi:MAG: hypothetical protein Q9217_003357 [Psora testacea]